MKKILIMLCIMVTLCLNSCGFTDNWIDFREDHTVIWKEIGYDNNTFYKIEAPNGRRCGIHAKDDLANVGDVIRYESGVIVVIKKKDIKKEIQK